MSSDLKTAIGSSLADAQRTLEVFIQDEKNLEPIQRMAEGMADCFKRGGKILICGNGGSACDSLHFAEECTGRFQKDRAALPVIPLVESGFLTCVSNDYGFEHVFSRGVEAYGKPGDILIAISTSGNSPNIIRAVEAARKGDVGVYLFIGKDGGKLHDQGDEEIWVRASSTERIQEVHMMVLHILVEGIERILFPQNYGG